MMAQQYRDSAKIHPGIASMLHRPRHARPPPHRDTGPATCRQSARLPASHQSDRAQPGLRSCCPLRAMGGGDVPGVRTIIVRPKYLGANDGKGQTGEARYGSGMFRGNAHPANDGGVMAIYFSPYANWPTSAANDVTYVHMAICGIYQHLSSREMLGDSTPRATLRRTITP